MTEEKLSSFFKTDRDGSRFKKNIREIFVLKHPAYRSSLTLLAVRFNPVDEGKLKMRHGLILRLNIELVDFREIF